MSTAKVTSVAHTGISTSDINRSLSFFRDVLGFSTTKPARHGGPLFEKITGMPGALIDIAYVEAPGHTFELLQYHAPSEKVTSTLRPCDNGHLHLSFNVDDIEAMVARMRAAGFEPVGPVQTALEAGGLKAIYTKGPDGLVIELMQPPAEKRAGETA